MIPEYAGDSVALGRFSFRHLKTDLLYGYRVELACGQSFWRRYATGRRLGDAAELDRLVPPESRAVHSRTKACFNSCKHTARIIGQVMESASLLVGILLPTKQSFARLRIGAKHRRTALPLLVG